MSPDSLFLSLFAFLIPLALVCGVIGFVVRMLWLGLALKAAIAHAQAFETQHRRAVSLAATEGGPGVQPDIEQALLQAAEHWRHLDAIGQQRHELKKAEMLGIAGRAGIPLSF